MARKVSIKSAADIDMARKAGAMAAEVLHMIGEHVRPGVTTDELDRICNQYIVNVLKAIPANVGYHGFPKTICASVNHVVCHGIPNEKVLKSGDIVNIDVTVIRDGFHGDTSRMYFVGKPSTPAQRLTETCWEALWRGIAQVRPGAHLGDIGHAIQTFVEAQNFSVVREYCGHGIGRVYHEDPQVLHYGEPGTGDELKAGMTFTIEPMVNAGKRHVRAVHERERFKRPERLEVGQTVVADGATEQREGLQVCQACDMCESLVRNAGTCEEQRFERTKLR